MKHRMVNIAGLNEITERIIGLAIEVHKKLGPGFVEKIYQQALSIEFEQNNIKYEKEKIILVDYKGRNLGEQRVDFLIDDLVILEIKTIDKIAPVHIAQMLSYLKAADKRLGLILNFAVGKLDIKRIII